MKNYVIVFLFLTAFVFGSEAQTKPSIGIYYNPAYTGRITRANSDLSWLKQESDLLENGSMGYSTGAFVEYALSKKTSIRGGAGFSNFGESIDSLNDFGIDKYRNDYRFVEVPLALNYYLGKNENSRPYFSMGYTLNYFLSKRITYSLVGSNRDEKTVVKGELNSISHAVRFAFGVDFILDKKWSVKTELFANQFVSSLTNDGVRRLPFAAGLSVQLRKK